MELKTGNIQSNITNMINDFSIDEIGDDHIYTGLETPMKPNAFEISDDEKKQKNS